jgi:hypothetical protein
MRAFIDFLLSSSPHRIELSAADDPQKKEEKNKILSKIQIKWMFVIHFHLLKS